MTSAVSSRRFAGVRDLIIGYPLMSFFVLAFGMSWLGWLPYVLSENGVGIVPFAFPELLGTSQFFGTLPGAYLGPLGGAFIVTAVTGGRAGLRAWVSRLFKWRVNWRWYLLCLGGVPAVLFVTSIPFAGGWENIQAPSAMVLLAFVPGLVLQMLTTGLAEEPGWRDFALPRLQPRFGPLRGNLILGPLWGCWHLPLFLTDWGGYPDVSWVRVAEFLLFCIAISIVMTWVFNRTGESLPLAMLMHVSVNNFFSVAFIPMFPTITDPGVASRLGLIAFGAIAIVLIIATRGRIGYRGSTAATRQSGAAEKEGHAEKIASHGPG